MHVHRYNPVRLYNPLVCLGVSAEWWGRAGYESSVRVRVECTCARVARDMPMDMPYFIAYDV